MKKHTEDKVDNITFGEFVRQMFMGQKAISSKRVCGFIGWIVCLAICLYCTIAKVDCPDIVEMLFICCTSLLGIDSITGIWKKEIVENRGEENNEDCL